MSYDIEKILTEWTQESDFESALEKINYDEKTKEILRNTQFFNDISERKINGKSVEKLKNINEGRNIKVNMSKIFHKCANNSLNNLPILYLLEITKAIINNHKDDWDEKLSGILGRAYRSFPSFLRDFDAKKKLENFFKGIRLVDIEFIIEQSSSIDAKKHADILVHAKLKQNKEIIFYIWLFQFSYRSIINIEERLLGNRGDLQNGVHILAPLNSEFYNKYSKLIRKLETAMKRLLNKVQIIENKKITEKKRKEIENKIDEYNKKIEEIKNQIEDFILKNAESYKKITIIHDWLLYSEDYIKEIGEDIVNISFNQPKLLKYEKLKDIIEKPRKILSDKYIFLKK